MTPKDLEELRKAGRRAREHMDALSKTRAEAAKVVMESVGAIYDLDPASLRDKSVPRIGRFEYRRQWARTVAIALLADKTSVGAAAEEFNLDHSSVHHMCRKMLEAALAVECLNKLVDKSVNKHVNTP